MIAIIVILEAMLFPVYAQAKNSAKQTANLGQMKQLAVAAQNPNSDDTDNADATMGGHSVRLKGWAPMFND